MYFLTWSLALGKKKIDSNVNYTGTMCHINLDRLFLLFIYFLNFQSTHFQLIHICNVLQARLLYWYYMVCQRSIDSRFSIRTVTFSHFICIIDVTFPNPGRFVSSYNTLSFRITIMLLVFNVDTTAANSKSKRTLSRKVLIIAFAGFWRRKVRFTSELADEKLRQY